MADICSATDESAVTMAPSWRKLILPRRSGPPIPIRPVDEEAVARIRKTTLETRRTDIEAMLAYHRTFPETAEAGRRYLAGQPDPLGAAAVARLNLLDGIKPADYADLWIGEHGLAFALWTAVQLTDGPPLFSMWSSADSPVPDVWSHVRIDCFDVALRLRGRLTLVGAKEYQQAVHAISPARISDKTKCIAAFMFPTETQWVSEACQEPTGLVENRSRLELLTSVSSIDMVCELLFHHTGWDSYYQDYRRILPTLVDRFGVALVPVLDRILDGYLSKGRAAVVSEALACLPGEAAFAALLRHADKPGVRQSVELAMARFPMRAAGQLAERHDPASAELLAMHLALRPHLAAHLPQGSVPVPEAAPTVGAADLPELLVCPPWTTKPPKAKPVVFSELPSPPDVELSWTPDELEKLKNFPEHVPRLGARAWGDLEADAECGKLSGFDFQSILLSGPLELARKLIGGHRVPLWCFSTGYWFPAALHRHGPALGALATLLAEKEPESASALLGPIITREVAETHALWLAGKRRLLAIAARVYLRRHGAAVAPMLVPAALGPLGALRDSAHLALRYLARTDSPAAVIESSRHYGDAAATAIGAIIELDPMLVLPKRIPSVPDWAAGALLTPVTLTDGTPLPTASVNTIVVMLMMSSPDHPYAGLTAVAEICDTATLRALTWSLHEAWDRIGAPVRHSWALDALAWFADNETVDRLNDIIRRWPALGRSARVPHGLDVLANIGSDHALLTIYRISQRERSKPLKERAKGKIREIALSRSLSAEQMADRLVPDLGLSDASALALDYGSRVFTVRFDERLQPVVTNESGTALKALPKPGKGDDAVRAEDSYRHFSALRRQVRTVAKEQLRRLEDAMIHERRWSVEEFESLFVSHPLLIHVVRRLLWAAFSPTGQLSLFRVAEDRTLADDNDSLISLAPSHTVGIAHPLHAPEHMATWGRIFADYELLQPFPQINRPVIKATEQDLREQELSRFAQATAKTFSLTALSSRGWEIGEMIDGPFRRQISRSAPSGRIVDIWLDPGIPADPREIETQEISVRLDRGTFAETGLVFASEIIIDVTGATAQ
ncbi:hypothetical protein DE4585_03399 [Mycobacteroides salmoniphilum]|uniref:DUF4132 domain-containing protein n=1 Tax=Mycobacteroides salmoniphilum TaxID=404941 RepID=A0A4R8RYL4_9MYCO|nr:DUF4132 domain-containing protein [Mycobacteroides salmoniphilum]TDZ79651.1 hypothetical protein DE4585_03399 [Mycobacteroides salmoniphilum]